jgi:hypothetical protein
LEKDKFKFFVPLTIEKGDDGGVKTIKVAGIASTVDKDSDGENLFPVGFDTEPLLRSGYINYNHQANKDPGANIGQPTMAKLVGTDLYLEGFLYPSNPLTKKVVEQIETLERDSPDRRMGWSIEGVATRRDPLNKKRVLEAMITGVAITPSPKNPRTLVNIMKGEFGGEMDLIDANEDEDLSSVLGAILYVHNIFGENGGFISRIDDFLIKCYPKIAENPSSIDWLKGELTKSMNTGNVPMPESMAGYVKKNVELNSKDIVKSENQEEIFTKSKALDLIVEAFPNQTSEVYEKIVIFANHYINKNDMDFGKDEILKALDTLTDTLEKGTSGKSIQEESEEKTESAAGEEEGEKKTHSESEEKDDKIYKSCHEIMKGNVDMDVDSLAESLVRQGFGLQESMTAAGAIIKEYESSKNNGGAQSELGTSADPNTSLKKGEESQELGVTEEEVDSKIEKALKSTVELLTQSFKGMSEILKQTVSKVGDIDEKLEKANKENEGLVEKLEQIGNQSNGRKSVARVTALERFEKGNEGKPVDPYAFDMSTKDGRSALSKRMANEFEIAMSRGNIQIADKLEKSIQSVEIAGFLDQEDRAFLGSLKIDIL